MFEGFLFCLGTKYSLDKFFFSSAEADLDEGGSFRSDQEDLGAEKRRPNKIRPIELWTSIMALTKIVDIKFCHLGP